MGLIDVICKEVMYVKKLATVVRQGGLEQGVEKYEKIRGDAKLEESSPNNGVPHILVLVALPLDPLLSDKSSLYMLKESWELLAKQKEDDDAAMLESRLKGKRKAFFGNTTYALYGEKGRPFLDHEAF